MPSAQQKRLCCRLCLHKQALRVESGRASKKGSRERRADVAANASKYRASR